MKSVLVRAIAIVPILTGSVAATTIRPLGFAEQVAQADAVIEGTVVEKKAVIVGLPSAPGAPMEKQHVAPQQGVAATASGEPPSAVSAGVEGGEMIFTDLVVAVDATIAGHVPNRVRLRIAGGEIDGRVAIVHGMPSFDVGQKYVLFLRKGFETSGDPIVGVNQGYYRVIDEPSGGARTLLNAHSDIVIAVEDDRVIVRRNPARAGADQLQLVAPPVPDGDAKVRAETSPEVARYWISQEPPMSPDAFADAVRASKEGR